MIVPVAPGELPSILPGPEAVPPRPPTTDAELAARLDEIVAAAARQAAGEPSPLPRRGRLPAAPTS